MKYHTTMKQYSGAIAAAPEAARRAKRKAWVPAGVILAKQHTGRRMVYGTRY